MNKKIWLSGFLFLVLYYFAYGHFSPSQMISYPNFYENPLLDQNMRKLMAPHLLPLDHPIKEKLDAIFSKSRAIQNQKTLTDAGFIILGARPISFIIVARHPEVPGYIFKLYLDTELRKKKGVAHWEWLTRRCVGAKKIKEVIKKKKLRHFIVPDKWLYILPQDPVSQESQQQPVLLVETYIELGENSELVWKTRIKPKHLDELYKIYKSGYGSVHVPGNIPYTKNGKFAFIDTESPKRDPNVKVVKRYLSKDMQEYWNYLIK
jgi:hypothetical protein